MEETILNRAISRRTALKIGAAGALASEAVLLEQLATVPRRAAAAAGPLPDIQFAIGDFIAPAFTVNGIEVRFGPVFTTFTPARLTRIPTKTDQQVLANALNTIEAVFPFSPKGVFTFISYGIPYFNKLPGGINGSLVSRFMPRLLSNTNRFALEEAVPSPTDFLAGTTNPNRQKKTFNVPVAIERNDVLLTLRSDTMGILTNILAWLQGSNSLGGRLIASPRFGGLFSFQRTRTMFQQIGLPRKVADSVGLPFRTRINPQSPMWMGFADQQTDSSGPAEICTFVGNASARLTNKVAGNYFDNGSIQIFNHNILDLPQFYATAAEDPPEGETYEERVQYAFRSNEKDSPNGLPAQPNADQFTDGGGPAFVRNAFQGPGDAREGAAGIGTFEGQKRIGHEQALQRSSRAADGTPIHIRMDGTGFDNLDVPGGANTAKLQFMAFVPTAEFFRVMRANSAALDLQAQFGVDFEDNGFERFMTATRRQNFLAPPRRHRAFPLLELT